LKKIIFYQISSICTSIKTHYKTWISEI